LAISSPNHSAIRALAREYSMRAVDDAPFAPLPLPDQSQKEDEEALKARMKRLSYEVPAAEWRALQCSGEPSDAPQRFIDGSVFSRTAAVLSVGGSRRPCILASLGALSLEISGRSLVRTAGSLKLETVLCILSNGMPNEHRGALGEGLAEIGVHLVASATTEIGADFEVLRRRCWDMAKDRMEEAERQVLLDQPDVPAVVDGLLERRLTTVRSQGIPAVGVVKRPGRQYLPGSHLNLMYGLRPNERTPAFVLETEYASLVSWYLRLSDAAMTSPSYGIVRMTVPQEYFERRFTTPNERSLQISALSAYLFNLRHRQGSYPRAGISLEPIVRVEDELHALLPDIRQQSARLHRALGI
jgi:hypothetical protein